MYSDMNPLPSVGRVLALCFLLGTVGVVLCACVEIFLIYHFFSPPIGAQVAIDILGPNIGLALGGWLGYVYTERWYR